MEKEESIVFLSMLKKKREPDLAPEIKYENRLSIVKCILKQQGKELTKKDKIKQFILDLTTLLSANIVGGSSLNDIKNTLTQHIFHIIDIIKG